jgi:drug/metabolite transporter (DMT)-like permease
MKKYTSTLLLLIAAIIWGSAFVAQKEATIIPTFTLVTLRSVIAGVFLIFVIIFSDWIKKNGRRLFSKAGIGITKRELIGGVICGAFLMIATVLQQIGIRGTEAGKASFITSLYVVIVPIYSLFFGKRSPLSTWIAVGGAVTGFFLLCIKDGFTIELADLYVLLCAFVFAMQIIAIDRSLPGCDGIRLSCVQFFTVALISGIAVLIFERDQSFVLIGDAIP